MTEEQKAEEYKETVHRWRDSKGELVQEEDVAQAFIDGYHECQKEHEWHYMEDVNCYEDLRFPPEEECKGKLLIWKVQVITEEGVKEPICYHCGSYDDLWYEINAYHVIAFKEIVPPKESE